MLIAEWVVYSPRQRSYKKKRYMRRETYRYTRWIAAFGCWQRNAYNIQHLEERKMHQKIQHLEESKKRKKIPRKTYNRRVWLTNSAPCQPALWAYYRHPKAAMYHINCSPIAQNSTAQPIPAHSSPAQHNSAHSSPSHPIPSHPTPAQRYTSSSAVRERTRDA